MFISKIKSYLSKPFAVGIGINLGLISVTISKQCCYKKDTLIHIT